ncbi:MAG: MFS transporter [Tenuifilum sp.]|uniref:MFS transporter n=1 Tax=Tenuifilum sp. TaxID=2760880 RepID=UPI001B43E0C4|nr:MFS transporter [Bacteroidales bacterium]HOK61551.1 MFS transporter [Tenuifilum sp.]MBP9028365.1 MFS transporter [Bacteroidales bacterium]HOK86206.1 MFS transporter [Tenuifilum sp.]HON70213.1 MFS transporter [Tenuifilum sp.]
MKNNILNHNLIRLYILKVSHWFMLVMPIVVLFYKENGLNVSQVFILQSVYSLSIVLLEIPSGYFADALGRKNTIFIGAVLGFIGFAIYSISYGFWGFLMAEVVLGFGQSMISGADSALLYDSLVDAKQQDRYIKHEGRMTSIGNFAEASAGILGGLLAAVSIRYPYYGQTLVALLAVPAAFTLIEPKTEHNRLELGWKQIVDVVRFALVKNLRLRWNILLSSVVGASTLTMAWFVQPWLIRADTPVEAYGAIWTVLNLLVGVAAMFAYRVELKLGRNRTTGVLILFLFLGFVMAGFIRSYWAMPFIVIFYLARGVATPILKDSINRIAPAPMRATILSVRNFIIRIIFSVWGPFYGWLTDRWSLKVALITAGFIFIILSTLTFIALFKVEREN